MTRSIEHLSSSLSQIDRGKSNIEIHSKYTKLRVMVDNFQSDWASNYSSTSSELHKLVGVFCILLENCISSKNTEHKLAVELEKTTGSTESAAQVLQKMEGKYKTMKSQVKEAKIVMRQQQSKFGELMNTISLLSAEKAKKDNQIEEERERCRLLVEEKNLTNSINEQMKNAYVSSSNGLSIECATPHRTYSYPYGSEVNGRSPVEMRSVSPGARKDEEDVKILHETLNFVETLAVNASELETRYEEVLSEKRLLKKMCSG